MSTLTHNNYVRIINERVESAVGADIRLIYGLAGPMLATTGLIIGLALSGQGWMVPAVLVFLIVTLAVVVFAVFEMMDEDEDDGPHRS